jgi:hypothetical protein
MLLSENESIGERMVREMIRRSEKATSKIIHNSYL